MRRPKIFFGFIIVAVLTLSVLLPIHQSRAASACDNLDRQFGDLGGANIAGKFPKTYCSVPDAATRVMNIMFTLAGIAAVIIIIYGGYQLMFSAGNEERANSGKKTLTYAVLGLVVIILAAAIVNVVVRLVSSNNGKLF